MPRAVKAIVFALLACASAIAQAGSRPSATFILGADRDDAGYFAAATEYFREHAQVGEEIVTTQRSLAGVREYLARRARDGAPWGTVRLVAHGSEWYGLRVPIYSDRSEEATFDSLVRAASTGEFPPLGQSAFDAHTRFVIESCGIARRPTLERALLELLFGNGDVGIEASRDYVAFRAWNDANGARMSERTELPYVSLIARSGAKDASASSQLRSTLEKRWPAETGRPLSAELVLRDVPVEIRQAIRGTGFNAQGADTTRVMLRNLGLRKDQLRWSIEGDAQVGRARIVTLSPIAADWVLAAGN